MKSVTELLIDYLSEQDKEQSISEILNSANVDASERTIRRVLKSLVEQGQVEAVGQFKARKYKIATSQLPTSQAKSVGFEFSRDNQSIITKITQPIYQRDPCTYNEAWLQSYEPNTNFYLSEAQRNLLHSSGELLNKDLPAATYVKKIFNRLLINLSYNSSRLEGNTYSLIETENLLLKGEVAEGKLDVERLMIINHKDAIRFLVDGMNHLVPTIENIRTLHYLLSDGLVAADEGGQVRKDGVRVSGTTYIPLENHERLSRLLGEIAEKAQEIVDPFEQSFFLLVHIAYLQAFIDVNKRTARLAANIPLVSHNLAPLSFNDVRKNDYLSALLAVYELNEVNPFSELYVWSYQRSAKHYAVTAEAMGIDVNRVLYRQQRREIIATIVNQCITGNKIESTVMEFAESMIPKEHQSKFIADTMNDLKALEPYKIAGMGISLSDYKKWRKG